MSDSRPAVIVTGSSGLLGQPVCKELSQRGYEVFGFDRVGLPEPPKALDHVHDIECDVTNYAAVRDAVDYVGKAADGSIASVVHMAAYYDFAGEDSDLYEKVTVHGTDRLLNALNRFDLEQFVFTSTMLVHRPCSIGEAIGEDDPLEAKWPYPQSKIDTERLIREGHPSVSSVFLRIAGVYTDYGCQPTLVQQIKRIAEKDLESRFYPGDVNAGQAVVHVDDAVDAIVKTVEHRGQIDPKTAILIGEPDPMPYQKIQDTVGRQLHGSEWTTMQIPKQVAEVGAQVKDTLSGGDSFIKPFMVDMADDHYAIDISRAEKLLGWQPKHSLESSLPAILESLRKDYRQWYKANGLEPPDHLSFG